ncbi:MAG: ThuA domain-containing protein [Planctomycetota bacterium]|jgi:type 1 glutamine amidotransferase/HEAT repeat protein
MKYNKAVNLVAIFILLLSVSVFAVSDPEVQKIADAMPDKPVVQPTAQRTMLVFSLCNGFKHSSIPYWKQALDVMSKKTGAFKVVHSDDMSVFSADSLKQFDAICLNNTTHLKPDSAQQQAILDFVKSGKGLVGIHAATDNFYEWPAGMEMMGGVFKGHPWGAGGTWAMKLDEPDHPLMKSFKGQNFKIKDEIYRTEAPLYSRENQRVLMSLDMSDPTTKNAKGVRPDDMDTGITWIKRVGKGRLFYCSLGHVHAVTWNSAVLEHFLAGIQYAMGDLKVDDRIPGEEDKVDALVSKLKEYDWDSSRLPLTELHRFIVNKQYDPQGLRMIEGKLLEALASGLSPAASDFVCRELSIIGTEASVPTLSNMLAEVKTSSQGRYALERIPGKSVDAALIEQLNRTEDESIQIGIVTSLGVRGSEAVVKPMTDIAKGDDQDAALAAIQAIGAIGTEKAADALMGIKVADSALKNRLMDAMLVCAEKTAENGDKNTALAIYRKLYTKRYPSVIQAAALKGIAQVDPMQAKLLVPQAMKSDDVAVQTAAIMILSTTEDVWLLKGSSKSFDGLDNQAKIRLITALSENPKRIGKEITEKATSSKDTAVRVAAYGGLINLGDAGSVELLAGAIINASDRDESSAAKDALYRISGKGVNEAVLAGITSDLDEKIRVELIRAAVERQIVGTTDILFKTAYSDSRRISSESVAGLQSLGQAGDIPQLLDLMVAKPKSSTENAMVVVAGKIADQHQRAGAIIAKYPTVEDPAAKVSMLRVMGKLGDKHSIALLKQAYASSDAAISQGAFRAMADWPGSDFVAEMKQLAAEGEDAKTRILAFRAYVRMLSDSNAGTNQIVDDLIAAFKMAEQVNEKKLVVSALGKFGNNQSLQFLKEAYADSQLKAEAEVSLVDVCKQTAKQNTSAAKAVLQEVLENTSNESVKKNAELVLDEIKKYDGFVLGWKVSKVYSAKDKDGNSLFDMAFGPEKNGSRGKWQSAEPFLNPGKPGIYNLLKLKQSNDCVVYLKKSLLSDQDKEVTFGIGSDDAVKVWVNGKLVHRNNATRPVIPGQDKVKVQLIKGENPVLVKVVQKAGNWGFCMRLND